MGSNPARGDRHVNAALGDLSVAFTQSQTNYIADKVFTVIPVKHESDKYHEYDLGDLVRDVAQPRGRSEESAGATWNKTDKTYITETYAIHEDVDDKDRKNADKAINPDRDATENVTQYIMTQKENKWKTDFFKTGVWTTDVSVSNVWNGSSGTPIVDIMTQSRVMQSLTGYRPNLLVLTPAGFDAAVNNTKVLDRIKHTQSGNVTAALLASLFNLNQPGKPGNVVVADAIINTAARGQDAVTTNIFTGGEGLLLYVEQRPGIKKPSAGYTFSWTEALGTTSNGIRIKKFRIEEINSDRVEAEASYDQKLVSANLGVFLDNLT